MLAFFNIAWALVSPPTTAPPRQCDAQSSTQSREASRSGIAATPRAALRSTWPLHSSIATKTFALSGQSSAPGKPPATPPHSPRGGFFAERLMQCSAAERPFNVHRNAAAPWCATLRRQFSAVCRCGIAGTSPRAPASTRQRRGSIRAPRLASQQRLPRARAHRPTRRGIRRPGFCAARSTPSLLLRHHRVGTSLLLLLPLPALRRDRSRRALPPGDQRTWHKRFAQQLPRAFRSGMQGIDPRAFASTARSRSRTPRRARCLRALSRIAAERTSLPRGGRCAGRWTRSSPTLQPSRLLALMLRRRRQRRRSPRRLCPSPLPLPWWWTATHARARMTRRSRSRRAMGRTSALSAWTPHRRTLSFRAAIAASA
jgi:hypothetical protein